MPPKNPTNKKFSRSEIDQALLDNFINLQKVLTNLSMRFDELSNNNFNKEAYMKSLGIKDLTRKIILYAPTWKWGNGTLHTYFHSF
ncbi:hypothetical protein, partial [uncultured Sulfitobacter sp.]|uniref:hypothetical protein n=1 Tax=uncultured Sulfitobacter sp. TaxID=191468 RepID=UPI00259267E2